MMSKHAGNAAPQADHHLTLHRRPLITDDLQGTRTKPSSRRKLANDFPGQTLGDLAMAGNRFEHAGGRLSPDIMGAAVTDELASHSFQLADQIQALHATSSSPLWY